MSAVFHAVLACRHAPFEGKGVYASCRQLLRRNARGSAHTADGDDRYPSRQFDVGEGVRIVYLQRVVGIHVNAAGDEPLGTVRRFPNVENSDLAPFRQPATQCFGIDALLFLTHSVCAVVVTGRPSAFQSGSPISRRRALNPCVVNSVTASRE